MSLRELASRNDGSQVVRLMCDPARDQTVLRFRDEERDETIIVDVPKEEALAAFNNPRDYLPSGVGEAQTDGMPDPVAAAEGPIVADSSRPDYLPIAEHGVIGDLHSVALVGTDGTIDWFCPGRFDAPSV